MAKHIALSYSRLSQAEMCLKKFHSQYLEKSYPDEGENFFFIKGQRKHTQLEQYVLAKRQPQMVSTLKFDDDVEEMFPMIDKLCEAMPDFTAEQKLAVDTNFKPCGWFDSDVMFRAIVDFRAISDSIMVIIDWKSGKVREYDDKPTGQLHLTAAIMFAHHPEVMEATTGYAFIEHKQMLKKVFQRGEDLEGPFFKAFEWINSITDWAPSKNQYCKYCLLTNKECPYK